MTRPLPVRVVIATAGPAPHLARTLEAVGQGALPGEFVETVVVENGSGRSAEGAVAGAPASLRARHIHVERANKSNALNAALATISGGLVIFFDDDIEPHPLAVVAYARAAEASGRGAFFGGSCIPHYEERPPDWLRSFFPPSARGLDLRRRPHAAFLGFNWAAFVEDIKAVGGFDPSMGPGSVSGALGDETNMQERLLAAGGRKRNVPEAVVRHYIPADRCTVDWALGRFYQQGVARGLAARRRNARDVLVRSLLALAKNGGLYPVRAVQRDPVKLMRVRASLYGRAGVLRGYFSRPPAPGP